MSLCSVFYWHFKNWDNFLEQQTLEVLSKHYSGIKQALNQMKQQQERIKALSKFTFIIIQMNIFQTEAECGIKYKNVRLTLSTGTLILLKMTQNEKTTTNNIDHAVILQQIINWSESPTETAGAQLPHIVI